MTYFISYEILFNNVIIGKAAEDVEATSIKSAIQKLRQEQGKKLLDEINKEKIVKGEKLWDMTAIMLYPIFIFAEETTQNGKTT